MRQLLELVLLRPLSAFLSSAELLDRKMSGNQMIEGMLSRMVHTLSSPYVDRPDVRREPPDELAKGVARDDSRAIREDDGRGPRKEAM
jgi:hypothetical protein